jgi:hypothetical protein
VGDAASPVLGQAFASSIVPASCPPPRPSPCTHPFPSPAPLSRHARLLCKCRYKLAELSNIAEVIDVCAACVDGSDDTFVEVLVALVNLCAKASAATHGVCFCMYVCVWWGQGRVGQMRPLHKALGTEHGLDGGLVWPRWAIPGV